MKRYSKNTTIILTRGRRDSLMNKRLNKVFKNVKVKNYGRNSSYTI